MTQDDLARLRATFGTTDLVHFLFDRFPFALRFDLGGATRTIDDPLRFLHALDRARAIARTFWPTPDSLALYLFARLDDGDATALDPDAAASLPACGLEPLDFRHIGAERKFLTRPDGSADATWLHAWRYDAPVTFDVVDRALWGAVAADAPIRPKFVEAYPAIVDFSRRTLAHVYDDRWMETVSMARGVLDAPARAHADWLCDGFVKL